MRRLGWLNVPLWLTYVFLYVPIAVLVVMSFNASKTPYTWTGFSTRGTASCLTDELIREGFVNTMIVAIGATVIATILGTLLAIGLNRYFRSALLEAYSLTPAIIPDLALAIGLLAFFALVGVTLGLHTVLLAHVVFGMAFVAAVVLARLGHTDPSLEEASRDLGAGPVSTFFRITVPSLMPAIVAGALLVFTLQPGRVRHRVLHQRTVDPDPADRHLLHGPLRRHAGDQRPGCLAAARQLHHRDRRPAHHQAHG